MYAQDFLFNGQKASDFGLIIGGMDSDGEAIVSGGEIEIVSARPPANDKYDYYVGNLDSPIQYNFGIMKLKCDDPNDNYITPEEESRIAKWLLRKSKHEGYGWLQFDQDYYRDINYHVFFTSMIPIQVVGRTIGFELSCISNCGYAFSNEKYHKFNINSTSDINIVLSNDMNTYVYPQIKLSNVPSDFEFSNNSDEYQGVSEFNDLTETVVTMDCDNDIVTGINNDPTKFNWIFPRMVDGDNIFKTNSATDIQVELKYREARRILV